MHIKIKLFTTLVNYVPYAKAGVPFDAEVAKGSTISELLGYLMLPENEVNIIFVNGRSQSRDYKLAEGDAIGIYPVDINEGE